MLVCRDQCSGTTKWHMLHIITVVFYQISEPGVHKFKVKMALISTLGLILPNEEITDGNLNGRPQQPGQ